MSETWDGDGDGERRDLTAYKVLHVLGAGAFGEVRLAVERRTNKKVRGCGVRA